MAISIMLISDCGDITLFYPDELNDCTELQLELLKESQLNSLSVQSFSVLWFSAGCASDTYQELLETCETDSIADMGMRTAEHILNAQKPLTRMPYGILYLKDKELIGPGDMLEKLVFGQFIDAEEQLFLFFMRKDPEHLQKLTAILYRPRFEKEYALDRSERSLKALKELSKAQLYVVLEYYLGCRTILANSYAHVFPKPIEKKDSALKKEEKISGKMVLEMVMGYHAKLVEYAKTPDRKKLMYHENARTVLEFINQDIKNYKAKEKAMAEMKRNNRQKNGRN